MAGSIIAPFTLAAILITYRGAKNGAYQNNPVPHLPMPSQYLSALMIFGALSIPTGNAASLAALTGWGLDVAILLNLWRPGEKTQTLPSEKASKP